MGVRLASGAGINIAGGMAGRGLASKVLSENGYHEMAEHYKVLDSEAMLLDGMIGTFFALVHTKEATAFSKKYAGKMGEIISDLKDGIMDRYIYRHANKDSSIGLHTSYEAHKDHIDLMASGIHDVVRGETPTFDEAKIKNVVAHSIEDPNFKSYIPDAEPQPVKKLIEGGEHTPSTVDSQTKTPFYDIDEHASYRYAELEAKSPEMAKDVSESVREIVDIGTTVKKKRLYEVAIDCFLRTGGT